MLTLRYQPEPASNVHLFPALSWAQHVAEGAAVAMMVEEQGDTCKDAAADRTWWTDKICQGTAGKGSSQLSLL